MVNCHDPEDAVAGRLRTLVYSAANPTPMSAVRAVLSKQMWGAHNLPSTHKITSAQLWSRVWVRVCVCVWLF